MEYAALDSVPVALYVLTRLERHPPIIAAFGKAYKIEDAFSAFLPFLTQETIFMKNHQSFDRLRQRVWGGLLLPMLLLSLSAALIAGLYPAWRTGRAPIATEVREE